jgi:hypothetical protein
MLREYGGRRYQLSGEEIYNKACDIQGQLKLVVPAARGPRGMRLRPHAEYGALTE